MDPKRFSPAAPGDLVTIAGRESAFVPHPLPPARWEFPANLWPLLSEAKHHLGVLEGIGSVLPNPSILLRPLSDREAIQSSRLEGTYATPRELLLFELQPPPPSPSESDRTQDFREVYNYQRALEHAAHTELPLSLRLIRELHGILLTGARGRDKTPGEFRRVQVAIGATRRFVPPPPEQIRHCLDPLEGYFHQPMPFDPLVDCFLVHYQFETIHPFVDGNGRVGRLLLAIMLQQRCGLSKPWLYLSEFFERHRDEYIGHLFSVSTEGAWSQWIEFCLNGALAQATATVARCRRLLEIRDEYARRVAAVGGNVRLSQIVEGVFNSPFVRVAPLARRLNVTYPTARADIDRLVSADILRALPDATPKTFYAPEVFSVAYGEMDDS